MYPRDTGDENCDTAASRQRHLGEALDAAHTERVAAAMMQTFANPDARPTGAPPWCSFPQLRRISRRAFKVQIQRGTDPIMVLMWRPWQAYASTADGFMAYTRARPPWASCDTFLWREGKGVCLVVTHDDEMLIARRCD